MEGDWADIVGVGVLVLDVGVGVFDGLVGAGVREIVDFRFWIVDVGVLIVVGWGVVRAKLKSKSSELE